MSIKWVKSQRDLRRMGNEGDAAWTTRQSIEEAVRFAREDYPLCKFRLYQGMGASGTNRVPDFTLTCASGCSRVIEIGITGSVRIQELEDAGHEVIKVGRGRGFDFAAKCSPCITCPHLLDR